MNLRTIKTEIQLRGSWLFEVEYDAKNRLTKLNFTHDHMLAQYQFYKDKVLVEEKQFVRYGLV
ncbi:peptidase C39, bacteriocin processing domain protein [Vibrio harveyi]|uniref:Peptidase C39, bacteriocin processing domain protein n=1 Tax=Vibrio harveyi TaxID=669 RepID=A0A454CW95_VIBHA|nr:peptidase C39, bacteriocin processing domain protein [Vibrio harveyi]